MNEELIKEFGKILEMLTTERKNDLLDKIVASVIEAGFDETYLCPQMNLICFNAFGDKE